MIHKKIMKLIPNVPDSNGRFITYPLWEEGLYIPFVNFCMVIKNDYNQKLLNDRIKTFNNKNKSYIIEYEFDDDYVFNIRNCVKNIRIYPDFNYADNMDNIGDYITFVKDDWSIEEMLDVIHEFINNK